MIRIAEYVVDSAPWRVTQPAPQGAATDIAHPQASQESSQTTFNTSMVLSKPFQVQSRTILTSIFFRPPQVAPDSSASQGLIEAVAPSFQLPAPLLTMTLPVEQVSVPPIEPVDHEMADQTLTTFSVAPLNGSAYTTTAYEQAIPEHWATAESNICSNREDTSIELQVAAGYAPPTIPGPTFGFCNSASQVFQQPPSQWISPNESLPQSSENFVVSSSVPPVIYSDYATESIAQPVSILMYSLCV